MSAVVALKIAALAALAVVCSLATTTPAHGSDLGPVGLTIENRPPLCPDATAVAAQTASHLGHNPFTTDHYRPTIRILYTRTTRGFGAELHLIGPPAFSGRRALDARTRDCAALAEPLAIVLAMTLEDASARGTLHPPRRAPEPETGPTTRAAPEPPTPPTATAPAPEPWHLALGPTATLHAFETPRIGLGGGLDVRLSRAELAFELALRVAASLPDPATPNALTFAATPRICWAPGHFDLCGGFLVGLRTFSSQTLTPLDPPATVVHVAPTVSTGVRISAGALTFRPAIEVGVALIRPRLSENDVVLWTGLPLVAGLNLSFLFGSADHDQAPAAR